HDVRAAGAPLLESAREQAVLSELSEEAFGRARIFAVLHRELEGGTDERQRALAIASLHQDRAQVDADRDPPLDVGPLRAPRSRRDERGPERPFGGLEIAGRALEASPGMQERGI